MATSKNQHPNDPRNPLNRPEVPEDEKQKRLRDNVVKHNGTYDHLETFQNERTGQYTVIGRKPNNQTIILGSSNQPIDLNELNELAANSPKRETPDSTRGAIPKASSRGGKGTDQGKGSGQQKKGSGTGATKSKAKAAPKAASKSDNGKSAHKRATAPKAAASRKAA